MAKPIDPAIVSKIIELRKQGMSRADIAKTIPISEASVKKQLALAGITLTEEQSKDRYNKQGSARVKQPIDGKFECSTCHEFKIPTEFHNDQNRPNGLTPACKACAVGYYQKVRNRKLETQTAYRVNNKEKIKIKESDLYQHNKPRYKANAKRWRTNNHNKSNKHHRKSERKHQGRKNARTASYRAAKLQATPPWLTIEQKKEIESLYVEARRLFNETGVKYHVDHIHALHGLTEEGYPFSGLHLPWNLEIIHWRTNLSKGRTHRA